MQIDAESPKPSSPATRVRLKDQVPITYDFIDRVGLVLGKGTGVALLSAAALAVFGNTDAAAEVLKYTANVVAHGVIGSAVGITIVEGIETLANR